MDPYIGEIRLFAGTFAPRDWAFCDGSLLPINGNDVLFSLYGTTFGGDGQNTFGLPDMRDRLPVGAGAGPGLSPYAQGQMGGETNVRLTTAQMPKHTHRVNKSASLATTTVPGPSVVPAAGEATVKIYSNRATANGTYASFSPSVIAETGTGDMHSNLMPSVGINFIVALSGIFPSST